MKNLKKLMVIALLMLTGMSCKIAAWKYTIVNESSRKLRLEFWANRIFHWVHMKTAYVNPYKTKEVNITGRYAGDCLRRLKYQVEINSERNPPGWTRIRETKFEWPKSGVPFWIRDDNAAKNSCKNRKIFIKYGDPYRAVFK